MATFVTDSFTGSAGTALASHTGETGATWTAHTSAGSSALVLSDANRCRNDSSATHLYYASGAPAGTDYEVSIDIRVFDTSTANYVGLAARLATGAETYYHLRYNTSGNIELYRFVAGSATSLGTWTATWFAGETHTIKLKVEGAGATVTLTVTIDGTGQTPVSDSDASRITAAGKAGVRSSSNAATNSTGQHIDNFSAADVGASNIAGPLVGSVPLKALVGGALA